MNQHDQRVSGIQSRIDEVRSRLQSLKVSSGIVAPLKTGNHDPPQEATSSYFSSPAPTRSAPNVPIHESSSHNYIPSNPNSQQPMATPTVVVKTDPALTKLLEDQQRQIQMMQKQMEMLSQQQQQPVVAATPSYMTPIHAIRTPVASAHSSFAYPPPHLPEEDQYPSSSSHHHRAAEESQNEVSPGLAQMQAMLREKLHALGTARDAEHRAGDSLSSTSFGQTPARHHPAASSSSLLPRPAQIYPVESNTRPDGFYDESARRPQTGPHSDYPLNPMRNGSRSRSRENEGGATPFSNPSVSTNGRGSSPHRGKEQKRSTSGGGGSVGASELVGGGSSSHLTALTGAEVFAVLRLRGIISTNGATGEHLLPNTRVHWMNLTHDEHNQLLQLRELLLRHNNNARGGGGGGGDQASLKQRSSPHRTGSGGAGGSVSGVPNPMNVSSVEGVAGFDKHRQRMNTSRATSPSAAFAYRKV